MPETIRAPRGATLTCKGWPQEAALRMLMNNLDPEVAERPADLVVYGGTGKAARSWDDYHAIVRELRRLDNDQTLLVQSGRPVGVFRTHEEAPRVLIANSNLVGKWATWEHFRELERRGLMMYGQMTAGSWIYIGSQGIVQGTFETFAAAAKVHYGAGADLAGRFVLSGGLGGMGGAQPLAATMAGGVFLGIEIDPQRVQRRLETRYLDEVAPDLDTALQRVETCKAARQPRSIALIGERRRCLRRARAARRDSRSGHRSDVRARSARRLHPAGAVADPGGRAAAARSGHVHQARARLDGRPGRGDARDAARGRPRVRLRQQPARRRRRSPGLKDAFAFPGFVPAYIRPLFCEGKGPFRWAALSGDPDDIRVTDEAVLDEIPDDPMLHRWMKLARSGSRSRGCRRGSAGSATASATASGCGSTSWCAPARSRRRS